MTENELLEIIHFSLAKTNKSRPTHQIILEFESFVEDPDHVERFVSEVQDQLDRSSAGILDIFSVGTDGYGGDFFIQCEEDRDPKEVFTEIRPILDNYPFFESSWVTFKVKDELKGYISEFESIHELIEGRAIDDPELPIPDGVSTRKGCLGLVMSLSIVVFMLTRNLLH